MTDEHETWRRLVLSYEDLDPVEQQRADAHLRVCPFCRKLLARLRQIEGNEGPMGSIPPFEAGEPVPLPVEGTNEAEESLALLRSRLGLNGRARVGSRRAGAADPEPRLAGLLRSRWPRFLAPATAVAVLLAVLLPRWIGDRAVIGGLVAIPDSTPRGSTEMQGRTIWRAGEAFRLRARAGGQTRIFVVHLDPRGRVAILYPESLDADLPVVSAGAVIDLPPTDSPERWVFAGEPGRETFFIVATRRSCIDGDRLTSELQRTADRSSDPHGKTKALVRRLRRAYGPVEMLELEQVP